MDSTGRTYSSAQRRYLKFCELYHLSPIPTTEQVLLWYIAYLDKDGVNLARTISVYLSAVRALHIKAGLPAPAVRSPRINLALKGLEKSGPDPVQKCPITYELLVECQSMFDKSYDHVMLWAAFTVAFFGGLRADEFTVDTYNFDPNKKLNIADIVWSDVTRVPQYVTITLKSTKCLLSTCTTVIGCSGSNVCGFCALKYYLNVRSQMQVAINNQALFVYKSGLVLDHKSFTNFTKSIVKRLGLNPVQYSGHSFRAGAATTAGLQKFKDWEVQLLGRWKSEVYKTYIRQPDSYKATFASRLAGNSVQ